MKPRSKSRRKRKEPSSSAKQLRVRVYPAEVNSEAKYSSGSTNISKIFLSTILRRSEEYYSSSCHKPFSPVLHFGARVRLFVVCFYIEPTICNMRRTFASSAAAARASSDLTPSSVETEEETEYIS